MALGWGGVKVLLLHADSSHCPVWIPRLCSFFSILFLTSSPFRMSCLPEPLSPPWEWNLAWYSTRLCSAQTVPFSSGYSVGLFQEAAEPSGNRLPSGPSHQPRHRELWTLGVDSSWDPPCTCMFPGSWFWNSNWKTYLWGLCPPFYFWT